MIRTNFVSKAFVLIAWAGVLTAIATSAADTAAQQTTSLSSAPERLSEMRHHFSDVVLVHEAVIRGDLPAVRAPAMRVAAVSVPTGVPDSARPFVVALRQAGQRAADARSLADAARATVAMVGECAKCHRNVGVFPAVASRRTPQVGGIVGHMLEHQLAADDLLLGLMVPSPVQWRNGAEQLRAAPLRTSQLPRDPTMTKWVREADVRLHDIADRASTAETDEERAHAYVDLMTTCAQCHSAHSKLWGPGRGTR